MRLIKARIQNYRSIKDTGWFEIENLKTILVGPNEAGKTVILRALQQLKKPNDIDGFDIIRDYPRSLYNDITTGVKDPKSIEVVRGIFELDDSDKKLIPENFHGAKYVLYRNLDNKGFHYLDDAPSSVCFKDLKKDLIRLLAHIEDRVKEGFNPREEYEIIVSKYSDYTTIIRSSHKELLSWLEKYFPVIEEGSTEEKRYDKINEIIELNSKRGEVIDILDKRVPVFVLFNNYFKVKPSIHLDHLATRVEQNLLEDEYYDYGNLCLLKLLGFSARELADIGSTKSPNQNQPDKLKEYRDKLDKRSYQLNAASVRLTSEIKRIWNPNPKRPEAEKIRISADGQYLKVVVEDDLGVEIELDQRSEGFQWIVSFFVVFFAEAMDKHKNAILLLDEPGMSLHGLKQRDFRETISRLAENNQTIYTTHSPFLVGSDELDLVRVVELQNRQEGSKVHTTISSEDPAGLLPLQEALGYDLAQTLFSNSRNFVLEGITDFWYVESVSNLLNASGDKGLNTKIALVFANSASKVVYYATILHAHNLKIAALLDSDVAGDQAAKQENLVHTIGNKNIFRTKDYVENVAKAEIEDMLRFTLPIVVKSEYNVDITDEVQSQPNRPIISILENKIEGFSKYRLAKSFVRWTRDNEAGKLNSIEITNWEKLFKMVNSRLK